MTGKFSNLQNKWGKKSILHAIFELIMKNAFKRVQTSLVSIQYRVVLETAPWIWRKICQSLIFSSSILLRSVQQYNCLFAAVWLTRCLYYECWVNVPLLNDFKKLVQKHCILSLHNKKSMYSALIHVAAIATILFLGFLLQKLDKAEEYLVSYFDVSGKYNQILQNKLISRAVRFRKFRSRSKFVKLNCCKIVNLTLTTAR